MRDYSDEDPKVFAGISVQRVFALLEILNEATFPTEKNIARLYSQYSECFTDILDFLIHLKLIRKKGSKLTLTKKMPFEDIRTRKDWLLSEIIHENNRYGSEIKDYLKCYKVEKGFLIFEATDHLRSRFSDVRNFLMEMGIVSYDKFRDRYILSTDYISLYSFAKQIDEAISPAYLDISTAQKGEIGLDAEHEIIAYEGKRLGKNLANKIDHVSLRNCAAGYDIKSCTLINNNHVVPRFIEVKAVPAISFRFYWSQNEIAVAKVLRDLYFLYLLPVNRTGSFSLLDMKIIADPYISVLNTPNYWSTETNVTCCSIKQCENTYMPD